jgi:hypothetical protein
MNLAWQFFTKHAIECAFTLAFGAALTLYGTTDYVLAMGCTAGAAFCGIVWCVTSPKVKEWDRAADRPMGLMLTFAVIAVTVLTLFFIASKRLDFQLSQMRELLLPADDSMPQTSCKGIPDNALRLYVGDNVIWTTALPLTVIQHKNDPQLQIDRDKSGGINIKVLRLFDVDGKELAEISDNEFNITNRALATHKPRPDRSTLVVYNEADQEVLNIRYLNPTALRVTGVFYFDSKRLPLFPSNWQQNCMHGTKQVIDF